MDFLKKYWKEILVSILIIIFAVYLYRRFKRPANVSFLTGGGSLNTVTSGGNIETFNPKPYADAMFNATDGIFTTATTKGAAAQMFEPLNNNQLIDVYNYWNKNYYSENEETLTQAMNAEKIVPFSGAWVNLLARLKNLNLN